ncbi:CrcB family protein [Actinoplanes sp. TRM 88003]|uniref:Fluoride-specific ion channel FluC n=1 Tax=Paractinoplanes aksuensis TaxID=2939490 RepID=A0ABT1DUV3_9ACTN|nr:CrcB family protein [Actinoplanes aksuensis]MCO8273461.1 CrcB family protein [Actinoplanes aksuensis]
MSFRNLSVIAAGGLLGALARHGLSTVWPHLEGGFPWATWLINVSGCLAIGIVSELVPAPRRLRLFLTTGFLGGYTTFSTAMTDVVVSPTVIGFAYLVTTAAGSLLAVWAGRSMARRARR